MKFNPICEVVMLAAIAAVGSLRADSTENNNGSKPVKLFVREVPITVLGRTVKVATVDQPDGVHGFSPEKSDGFHVELVNQLPVPTSIHWHGLILPNLMDGVPYLTEEPIPPGGSYQYDFALKQSGTYWMHSHYGLQEQQLASAPMVIRTPQQSTGQNWVWGFEVSGWRVGWTTRRKSVLSRKSRCRIDPCSDPCHLFLAATWHPTRGPSMVRAIPTAIVSTSNKVSGLN